MERGGQGLVLGPSLAHGKQASGWWRGGGGGRLHREKQAAPQGHEEAQLSQSPGGVGVWSK